MPFEHVVDWSPYSRPRTAPEAVFRQLGELVAGSWQRKTVSTFATVGIHALLCFWFLLRLGNDIDIPTERKSFGLSVFDLGEAGQQSVSVSQKNERAAAPDAAPLTAPIETPTEWTVSTIRVPKMAAASAATRSGETGEASEEANGGSAGGGAGYDPYAGASPQPLNAFSTSLAGSTASRSSSSTLMFDRDFVSVLRGKIQRQESDPVRLLVTFDKTGRVSAISFLNDVPDRLKAQLKALLMGKVAPVIGGRVQAPGSVHLTI